MRGKGRGLDGYYLITETPGQMASPEQLERLYQRYHFALGYAEGMDVLEVACGSGIGLGYLATKARSVAGGDIDERNVETARAHYRGRPNVTIHLTDAHQLPWERATFGLVLLYEALYYLERPEVFIAEAARVLRERGKLVICTVNKDWRDFHPSRLTSRYFSIPELHQLLRASFPEVRIYGSFPTRLDGTKEKLLSGVKRAAVRLHLIPGSLKGRAVLKRFVFGKLHPLPGEITPAMTCYADPVPLNPTEASSEFKVIYAVARKNAATNR
jgi:ubiquinone/menaquinone biosynthesis C-methylase UbiE